MLERKRVKIVGRENDGEELEQGWKGIVGRQIWE
jgi:hypothetical protein